jgi:aryl-alcohol dehydrogenase-like predicted oxidoreductase
MEYRKLGRSGLSVSCLGFGCAPMSDHDYGRVDDQLLMRAVRQAVDRGVNFFDTADVYGFGRAESLLADALGNQRNHVILATKCGLEWDVRGRIRRNGRPEHIRKAVEASLRRLKIESLPLLQLHWPDPTTHLFATLNAMNELRRAGKVQQLGVCNLTTEALRAISAEFSIASIQIAYNLLCRNPETELFDVCDARGIGVLAHSALARGFLTGKYVPGQMFRGSDTRSFSCYFSPRDARRKQDLVVVLRRTAQTNSSTCSATALRWVLDEPRIAAALAGIKSTAQLHENLDAIGWSLPAHDYARLCRASARCNGCLSGDLAGKEVQREVVSNHD